MDSSQTFAIPDNVMYEKLEGRIVILNLDTERYHSLNEVGSRIWELLVEGCDSTATVAQLLNEFEVAEHELRVDAATLIEHLVEAGLLSRQ